jgi:hypothetical protein
MKETFQGESTRPFPGLPKGDKHVVLQHTTCGWTFTVELTQRRSLEKPNMLSFTYPFLRYPFLRNHFFVISIHLLLLNVSLVATSSPILYGSLTQRPFLKPLNTHSLFSNNIHILP